MDLRPYQTQIAADATATLLARKIVYLAMEVRTGKTVTALQIAKNVGAKNVLFLTKKKALPSIRWDYDNFLFDFRIIIANDEQLHNLTDDFDLIIHDEHHRFGSFPKPSKTAVLFKKKYSKIPMIFLSGTPTPESFSQFYHQFWVSDFSPFREYKSFYKWADKFVDVVKEPIPYGFKNNYSNAKYDDFCGMLRHLIFKKTQVEAGFVSEIKETVFEIKMKDTTLDMMRILRKNKIIRSNTGNVILADTGAKMLAKLHQICSGTCKLECGGVSIFDNSKAVYIAENFAPYKIGIFYKFQAEFDMLKAEFGDKLTNDIDEFNTTDKWIALQIVAGREGISLKKADYLVYLTIDFSATSYWQSRDRMTTIERLENEIFYIFAKGGIESRIYKSVLNKKTYTTKIFEDDEYNQRR